ncbi:MAG: hypothetical protein GX748_03905, partial [Lentisphaerae bacterium]|nr:hypothetical protein [Lentisphaerota bacterium]
MKQKAKHVISGEAEVLKALGRIREGRKVSVSYVQGGFSVATVRGRWVASDPPLHVGWMVFGSGSTLIGC